MKIQINNFPTEQASREFAELFNLDVTNLYLTTRITRIGILRLYTLEFKFEIHKFERGIERQYPHMSNVQLTEEQILSIILRDDLTILPDVIYNDLLDLILSQGLADVEE